MTVSKQYINFYTEILLDISKIIHVLINFFSGTERSEQVWAYTYIIWKTCCHSDQKQTNTFWMTWRQGIKEKTLSETLQI